jgi:dephospho-CoA kinase
MMVVITGAAGAGKSSVAERLRKMLSDWSRFVVLDTDLFLHHAARDPAAWVNDWLLLAHALAENRLVLVLCGSLDPNELMRAPAYRLLASLQVILLDCTDDIRRDRLTRRPPWRGWDREKIELQVEHATTLRERDYFRLDTSMEDEDETAWTCQQYILDLDANHGPAARSTSPAT